MPVVVAPGSALLALIAPEMEVTWNQGGVYYAGRIRAITPADEWRADYIQLAIECQDYTSLLIDDICTSARSVVETDAQRISWLMQTFGRKGISCHNVQTLYLTMPTQDFTGMTLTAAITAILTFSGGGFYVDDFKDLHTFIAESLTAPFALSDNPDGVTNFGYRDFKYPQDSVDLRNAVYGIPGVSPTPPLPLVPDSVTETITTVPQADVGVVLASFKPAANQTIGIYGVPGPFAIGSNTAVAPTFGQATAAGHLLVAWVTSNTAEATTAASGWIKVNSHEDVVPLWHGIWIKPVSVANEVAPSFSNVGGLLPMMAQLAEFTGTATNPIDKIADFGLSPPITSVTITNPAVDGIYGALVVKAARWGLASPATATWIETYNNGVVPMHIGDSGTLSLAEHSSFSYGLQPASVKPTWYTDNTSIATYGRREASFAAASTVTTQAALDAFGAAYLAAHSNPLKHASLLLPPGSPAGLTAGMTIPVTNSLYGLAAQPFRIQSVDTTYPADNLPQFAVQFADSAVTMTTQLVGLQSQITAAGTTLSTPASTLGTLGYAQVTASQTGIVGVSVDLTGLAVTVTVGSGRRIRITGYGIWSSTVSGDAAGFNIFEGAAQVQAGQIVCQVAALSCVVSVVLTPTAGSHTYKLVGVRSAGTGSLTLNAAGTDPAWILVEDAGT